MTKDSLQRSRRKSNEIVYEPFPAAELAPLVALFAVLQDAVHLFSNNRNDHDLPIIA
jgi:hypothetical protein